jgi:hypothetical protein
MKAVLALLALLAALALAGCLSDYTLPSDGSASARVKVARKATPMICVAGQQTRLVPDREGYAQVPAERPITLTAQFEGHDFVCIPAVSFTAEANASYMQTFEVVSRSCSTKVLRETAQAPVPVASSEPASYGCRGRP